MIDLDAECKHGINPAWCTPCKHGPAKPPPADRGPLLPARFPGTCRACGFDINPGEPIRAIDGAWHHGDCS